MTQWVYNAAGELTETIDAMNRVTQFVHDGDGNLIQTIAPNLSTGGAGDASTTTTDAYDLDGERTSQTVPTPGGASGPATTSWQFDDLGNVVKETQPVPGPGGTAPVWQYFYNADSQLIKEIDPLGRTQTTTLDGMDRPTAETGFDGVPTSWTYDNLSEVQTTTVGTGTAAQTTTNTWDGLGNKTAVQDGNGATTHMAFDLAGQMTSLTDSDSNVTNWTRDNLGRVTAETNADGTRTFAYDANSNLVQEVDGLGRTRDFVFDALNRQTAEQWMQGSTVANTIATAYNADGEVTAAGDSFSNYAFGYDGQGNLASTDNAGTPGAPDVVLSSQFDAQGNRTSLSASIAGVKDFLNSYSYDALSQLTDLTQQGQTGGNAVAAKSFYLGHNALGDVTTIDRANYVGMGPYPTPDAADTTLSYNSLDQLTGISHAYNGTVLDSLTWTFDPLGRVATFGSSDGTATYGYDKDSQVVSAAYTTATGGHQPGNESNAFDPNGNLANTGNTVSSGNHLTNDGTFTWTFDAEGNVSTRTRISSASASDYKLTYTWDYRDRLTDVNFYNNSGVLTQHVHYVWDVFDHLIERDLDPTGGGTYTQTIHNVWDFTAPPLPPSSPLAPREDAGDGVIVFEFNGQQQLTNRYLNGPNTNVNDQFFSTLAQEAVTSPGTAGTVTYPLLDNEGSVRDMVDANGNLIDHVTYTVFGQIANETNPSAAHLASYAGGLLDSTTGMLNEHHRWLVLSDHFWASEDPLGFAAGDANLSRYVGNTPTNFIDSSGLFPDSSDSSGGDGESADDDLARLAAALEAREPRGASMQDHPHYVSDPTRPGGGYIACVPVFRGGKVVGSMGTLGPRPSPIILPWTDIVRKLERAVNKSDLASRLMAHYEAGSGKTFVLSPDDMAAVSPIDVSPTSSADFKAAHKAALEEATGSANFVRVPISTTTQTDANEGGTLGRFTILHNGILTVSPDGAWAYCGTMSFVDTYNFEDHPEEGLSRRNIQTAAVRNTPIGTDFLIRSAAVPLSESSFNRLSPIPFMQRKVGD